MLSSRAASQVEVIAWRANETGDRIRRGQGEREQGDSPLLEEKEEEDGGKGRAPARAPHADLLSSAICTLPPRHSARPCMLCHFTCRLYGGGIHKQASPSSPVLTHSLTHSHFHLLSLLCEKQLQKVIVPLTAQQHKLMLKRKITNQRLCGQLFCRMVCR